MILPLHHQLLNHKMKDNDDDTELIKHVKHAVSNDLANRYSHTQKELTATHLDTRFKLVLFLSDEDK